MRRLSPVLTLALLAACAQPFEPQVARRLAAAGIPDAVARCMAERWTDRLDIVQLRRIAAVADGLKDSGGRVTPRRFARAVRDLDDPEITEVVTNSAIVCALTA